MKLNIGGGNMRRIKTVIRDLMRIEDELLKYDNLEIQKAIEEMHIKTSYVLVDVVYTGTFDNEGGEQL